MPWWEARSALFQNNECCHTIGATYSCGFYVLHIWRRSAEHRRSENFSKSPVNESVLYAVFKGVPQRIKHLRSCHSLTFLANVYDPNSFESRWRVNAVCWCLPYIGNLDHWKKSTVPRAPEHLVPNLARRLQNLIVPKTTLPNHVGRRRPGNPRTTCRSRVVR